MYLPRKLYIVSTHCLSVTSSDSIGRPDWYNSNSLGQTVKAPNVRAILQHRHSTLNYHKVPAQNNIKNLKLGDGVNGG
jgi:hypothetical protein